MYRFQLKTFSNGLRLLLVPVKEMESFQFTLLVNTGSDFESKNNNGVSHFLEHLCFKGTKKRKNNLEIVKELDSVGASYNAFTSREITGYYTKVASQHFLKAIDIVSDIYLNSLFPQEEIIKEKNVILEEIKMYYDDPKTYIFDLWDKLLYGDQPAGWPISGTIDNVKNITRQDILQYYQKRYQSGSTILIASGNFNKDKIIKWINTFFRGIISGYPNSQNFLTPIKTPSVLLEYRSLKQTNFILGVSAFPIFDRRRYALDVLDAVLDGGMSGRLYQLVREKLGAAYYVSSFKSLFSNRGEYGIVAGINSDRIETIKEILKELINFTTNKISNQELKKAKDFLIGRTALQFESAHNLALDYGNQLLLLHKIESPQGYLRKIKSISSRDLIKVAQELFTPKAFKLAIIGPYKDATPFYRLLKI